MQRLIVIDFVGRMLEYNSRIVCNRSTYENIR